MGGCMMCMLCLLRLFSPPLRAATADISHKDGRLLPASPAHPLHCLRRRITVPRHRAMAPVPWRLSEMRLSLNNTSHPTHTLPPQVEQCAQNPPLPAMVPAEGIDITPAGANNTTPLWTYDVKEAVDVSRICTQDPHVPYSHAGLPCRLFASRIAMLTAWIRIGIIWLREVCCLQLF